MDQKLHEKDGLRIVARLRSAGWDMADGAVLLGRAALAYDNGQVVAELEQDDQRRELIFSLTAPDGRGLTVYPVYGDRLEATLDAVVGFQDRVTAENLPEVLGELVMACPEVYLQEGEDDEPRLLTPE